MSKVAGAALSAIALTLYGCGSSDDATTTPMMPTESIAELATSAGLTTLVAALTAADLASTFSDASAGPFTVFAPTNDAFEALSTAVKMDIVTCLVKPENKAVLTEVLQFHVHSGEVLSSALTNGMDVTTLLKGEDLTVTIAGETVTINPGNAKVTQADVMATNGVVHVIDNVLVPTTFAVPDNCGSSPDMKTIAELATAAGLDTLVAALGAADLVDLFANASAGPYTVFAPTDDAFKALDTAVGFGLTDCLVKPANKAVLTQVLEFHVHSGSVMSTQLTNGMKVSTLLTDEELTVTIDGATVTINPGNASVIQADVEASNGVVHVIDAVLVPGDFAAPDNCQSVIV